MTGQPADDLGTYESFEHTDEEGRSRTVYVRGSGPPVIILHELFGISAPLLRFASRVVDGGFTVYLPSLVQGMGRRGTVLWRVTAVGRVCISAEFIKLATSRTSPIVEWLRSLARRVGQESGLSVGAIGMCLTGGFALAMAVNPAVGASVVAQPFLPVGVGGRRRRDLGLDPSDLEAVKARSNLRVFGVRFSADAAAPRERFDRMQHELGERFVRNEIPSGAGSATGLPRSAHSTLTHPVLEDPSHPAFEEMSSVLDRAIDFLRAELARAELRT